MPSWTAEKTWTTGSILPASDLNIYLGNDVQFLYNVLTGVQLQPVSIASTLLVSGAATFSSTINTVTLGASTSGITSIDGLPMPLVNTYSGAPQTGAQAGTAPNTANIALASVTSGVYLSWVGIYYRSNGSAQRWTFWRTGQTDNADVWTGPGYPNYTTGPKLLNIGSINTIAVSYNFNSSTTGDFYTDFGYVRIA